jgi:hypothetical protein
MALDAAAGRSTALKLVLTLLDKACGIPAQPEEDDSEQLFTATELLSLLQMG